MNTIERIPWSFLTRRVGRRLPGRDEVRFCVGEHLRRGVSFVKLFRSNFYKNELKQPFESDAMRHFKRIRTKSAR
jgi:hypothetical protein